MTTPVILMLVVLVLLPVVFMGWCLWVTGKALADAKKRAREAEKQRVRLEALWPLPGQVGTLTQFEQGEEVLVASVVYLNKVPHLVLVTHGDRRMQIVCARNVTVDNQPVSLGTRGCFHVKFPRNADGSVNTNLPVRLEKVTEQVRVYA